MILTLLAALLPAMCHRASALTVTDEELACLMFPWWDDSRQTMQCTDEPEQVEHDEGNLMLKFVPMPDTAVLLSEGCKRR